MEISCRDLSLWKNLVEEISLDFSCEGGGVIMRVMQ